MNLLFDLLQIITFAISTFQKDLLLTYPI